jgi:hypothetical protein
MAKQGKQKQAQAKQPKGIHVGIHFPKAAVPEDLCQTLGEHLKSLAPELVRGLKERTGREDLGEFDLNKEMAPDLNRPHNVARRMRV